MKWFFGVVVLLNLLVALWGNLKTHPAADIHAQEVSPRAIRLLPADWGEGTLNPGADVRAASLASAPVGKPHAPSGPAKTEPKQDASAPAKAESAKAPAAAKVASANACYDWGELDGHALTRIRPQLVALNLTASEQAGKPGRGSKFWVYYPAQQKAKSAELKGKGFDNYQVQNEGEFKGALSLGLFAKESGANDLLAKLKNAGFTDAQITPRGGVQHATLSFKNLTAQQSSALQKLQQRMAPGVALKSTPCS
jgi:cell division septation protein DedD